MSKIKVGDFIKSKFTDIQQGTEIISWNKLYEVTCVDETGFRIKHNLDGEFIYYFKDFDKYFQVIEDKTDPIVESVVNKFLQRSKVGIDKYGTTLNENNNDNFLNHLQEELMDGVNYIEKLQSQQNTQQNVIEWAKERNLIKLGNAPNN